MHTSPTFRQADREAACALIGANPFATLVVNGDDGPVVALAPMVLAEGGAALHGHLARGNPLWGAAENRSVPAVAVFHGANAYVSPGWYASKAEHGRVVPTWNYRAVEARGSLSLLCDAAMMTGVEALTDKMEAGQTSPWRMSDAPADYINRLKGGIVGVRLTIATLTAVDKLSQNKSATDRAGVAAGLSASSRPGDRALAEDMHAQEQT